MGAGGDAIHSFAHRHFRSSCCAGWTCDRQHARRMVLCQRVLCYVASVVNFAPRTVLSGSIRVKPTLHLLTANRCFSKRARKSALAYCLPVAMPLILLRIVIFEAAVVLVGLASDSMRDAHGVKK